MENKRFFYEKVNTASRMESHGEPERLHASAASFTILEKNLHLAKALQAEARGAIEVKGKGLMDTYFIRKRSKEKKN